jgi:hypothetical protein
MSFDSPIQCLVACHDSLYSNPYRPSILEDLMFFDGPALKTGLLNNIVRLNKIAFDCNFKFKTVRLQMNEVETKLPLYNFSFFLFLANFHTFALVSIKFGMMVEDLPGEVLEILKHACYGVKAILFLVNFLCKKICSDSDNNGVMAAMQGKRKLYAVDRIRK